MAFDCFDTKDTKQAACWSATLLASVAGKKDKGKVLKSTGKMDLWTVLSQRTCPKPSDSQFLQLGSYMSSEPTPKTEYRTPLPWVKAIEWVQARPMTDVFVYQVKCKSWDLPWGERPHGYSNWYRMQPPIFELTLETVYIVIKPCTITAPPGNLCPQECNKTRVLPFNQEYQLSLGRKCFPQNNILVVRRFMTWWEKLSTPANWWIYSVENPSWPHPIEEVVQTDTGCSLLFLRCHWRQCMFLSSLVLLQLLLTTYVHKNTTWHGCSLSPRNTNHLLERSVSPPKQYPSSLVLDHLRRETVDSDKVMDLLSLEAHHLSPFMIVVTQNLYALGKHSMGMNRNYQYTTHF